VKPSSWLSSETQRPLCILRTRLLNAIDLLPKPKDEKGPWPTIEDIEKIFVSLPEDLFPTEKLEALAALDWLRGKPAKVRLDKPGLQAIWGAALLANKKLQKPQNERDILFGNERLIQEKNMMGSLLLGTIQNPKTTISWGPSGSWFYNDPTANHINMDPGQALLLGLQNSRGILLHEIGHSQITEGRSPKILQLRAKIKALIGEPDENGNCRIPREKIPEIQKLSQELSMRESLWQYTEDATVNTYAEIEGANFTSDIQTALFRCYATTCMNRQEQSKTPGIPKELLDLLSIIYPEIKVAQEIMDEISSRLKAASASYPIQKGWMDIQNEEDWKITEAKMTPENLEITNRLCGDNPEAIASIQPGLAAKRFEILSPESLAKITAACATRRNQICDEIFDEFILPLFEKIPPLPKLGGEGDFILGPEKEAGEGKAKPGKGKASEEKEDPQTGDKPTPDDPDKKPDYDKILHGTSPVEDKATTLQEAKDANEARQKELDEEDKKKNENRQTHMREGIKASMGSKSPLETLPTGCGNYQEAAEACRPQIAYVTSILKKIALHQRAPRPTSRQILPDHRLGAKSFILDSYLERKKKERAGETLSPDDKKHFLHEDPSHTKPATTHLAFYIDGSGSMSGTQAEKTMLTLVIFNEASKRVPEIHISAVYSGASKTQLLFAGGNITQGQEALVASILKTGFASGDNEICASGLAEMTATVEASLPKTGKVGLTHTLFLTDGGTTLDTSIPKAITALLDNNPLSTFDTTIVDGTRQTNFHNLHDQIVPKHKNQAPGIQTCQNVGEICPSIVSTLLGRIRQFRSFEPQTVATTKQNLKKTKKKLAILEIV